MKKLMISLMALMTSLTTMAQGWPANYEGVMLQGFYWDSYNESKWTVLQSQADELAQYFKLVWIPQSGNCKGQSMGYDDYWWFPGNNNGTSYNSSFGTETELRDMISTFKQKGIGTIADVVINHRKNRSNWVDFPKETYKGVEYRLQSTDICKYDDKYYDKDKSKWVYPTKDWADANGYELGARDTGEDWSGMRDLDHTTANVQTNVKAYLKMLLNDLGYAGFRYDMVKGYGAEYTKIYNQDSNPTYSVGECWDSSDVIKNWIEGTGKTSAAFDFQFRYTVRNAINNSDWSQLGQSNGTNNYPLISNDYLTGNYRQWAVTFVENHDVQDRGTTNNYTPDPILKDTLAANAFMMAMPGTPCVFLAHWIDCKQYIKPMIEARNLAGLKNTSGYEVLKSQKNCYAVKTDDKLICIIGDATQYTPSTDFVKVLDGYHYAYYLRKNLANRAWVSHESGHYMGEQQVVLAAITTQNARMVYTLDGTNPTPSSPSVASGEKITIPAGTPGDNPVRTTTLKAAMLVNGVVTGSIITRTYEVEYVEPFSIPDFCTMAEGEIGAFFEAPTTWGNVNCYTWTNSTPFDGNWTGRACTQVGTRSGKKVWKWSYSGTKTTQPANIIFNDGSNQTDNMTFKNGGYYNKDGIMGIVTVTGIDAITIAKAKGPQRFYTLDGRLAGTSYSTLSRGVYVVNGKKVIK